MLTAGLRLVHSAELPLMTLIKAMSSRPAEILGLAGGTLRQGSPADVIVIDLDSPWVLDPAELKSKCKNTPFDEAQAARVAWCAPSWPAAPCTNTSERPRPRVRSVKRC